MCVVSAGLVQSSGAGLPRILYAMLGSVLLYFSACILESHSLLQQTYHVLNSGANGHIELNKPLPHRTYLKGGSKLNFFS